MKKEPDFTKMLEVLLPSWLRYTWMNKHEFILIFSYFKSYISIIPYLFERAGHQAMIIIIKQRNISQLPLPKCTQLMQSTHLRFNSSDVSWLIFNWCWYYEHSYACIITLAVDSSNSCSVTKSLIFLQTDFFFFLT